MTKTSSKSAVKINKGQLLGIIVASIIGISGWIKFFLQLYFKPAQNNREALYSYNRSIARKKPNMFYLLCIFDAFGNKHTILAKPEDFANFYLLKELTGIKVPD